MSTTIEPSSDLLSMPNEILAKVCTYAVDKNSLKAIRLTCKHLYDPATTAFAKRFFTTLRIMATRGSLGTLLEICKHPLIGPRITEIKLYGCGLDPDLLTPLERVLDSRLRDRDLSGTRRARHRLQLLMDSLEEEMEFEQQVGIFQLLVTALGVIRSYGHSIGLAVFTDPDAEDPQMLGHQETVERVSEWGETTLRTTHNRESVKSSFRTLFAAVAKSGCRMHRLELIDFEAWYQIDYGADNSLNSRAVNALLDVEALHLNSTCDLFTDNLDGFANAILPLTKNLKSLHVTQNAYPDLCFVWAEAMSFGRTIQLFPTDHLHRIKLEQTSCRQADLMLLLKKHKHTMRYLELSEFGLVGSWEEVLIWMRDHCPLLSLSIENLYEYDEDRDEMMLARYVRFRGSSDQLTGYLEQRRKALAEHENHLW